MDTEIRGFGIQRPTETVPGNILVRLLLPAVNKVYGAQVRIKRVAHDCSPKRYGCTRWHDGKPPAKLEDVNLPLPLDPYTGQSFDKFYKVEADGTAVLMIPPPPPNTQPSLGRRFELIPKL